MGGRIYPASPYGMSRSEQVALVAWIDGVPDDCQAKLMQRAPAVVRLWRARGLRKLPERERDWVRRAAEYSLLREHWRSTGRFINPGSRSLVRRGTRL